MGRRGGAMPPPQEAGGKHNQQENGTGRISGNAADNGCSIFLLNVAEWHSALLVHPDRDHFTLTAAFSLTVDTLGVS